MQNTLAPNPVIFIRHISLTFILKRFRLLFFVLTISLLIFYVFQINNLISNNYSIVGLEKKISILKQENENLKTHMASIGSLERVDNLIVGQQFEEITQIHYIQISDSSIVIAR